ncbi:SIS domain-containing protein [Candidatus Latescibacterota bacterium]
MNTDLSARLQTHIVESAKVTNALTEKCLDPIIEAAKLIAGSFGNGGKVLICGNGGSAADSQHMAAEFVSRLTKEFERPGLPAIALTTDTSFLTAFTNDCGYENVFVRQVSTLGMPGDILIGISTSGGSKNVIQALKSAHEVEMGTIALTGAKSLGENTTVTINVPSSDTQYIQEAHLTIEHIICDLVEQILFC